jgi:hypothetical protein
MSGVDVRSLYLGVGVGIFAGFLLSWVLRILPRVGKIVLLAALICAGGLAYLGWMRRSAGLSQDLVATPQTLVDDAKTAVEKMNLRLRQQDEELKKIEAESKK